MILHRPTQSNYHRFDNHIVINNIVSYIYIYMHLIRMIFHPAWKYLLVIIRNHHQSHLFDLPHRLSSFIFRHLLGQIFIIIMPNPLNHHLSPMSNSYVSRNIASTSSHLSALWNGKRLTREKKKKKENLTIYVIRCLSMFVFFWLKSLDASR